MLWWSSVKRMKAISPFSPMGQRPVSVSPRTSLYHVIDLSTLVHWMPTCPTRLIVNPLAIFTSSLPQVRPSYDVHRATVRTRPSRDCRLRSGMLPMENIITQTPGCCTRLSTLMHKVYVKQWVLEETTRTPAAGGGGKENAVHNHRPACAQDR